MSSTNGSPASANDYLEKETLLEGARVDLPTFIARLVAVEQNVVRAHLGDRIIGDAETRGQIVVIIGRDRQQRGLVSDGLRGIGDPWLDIGRGQASGPNLPVSRESSDDGLACY